MPEPDFALVPKTHAPGPHPPGRFTTLNRSAYGMLNVHCR